MSELNDITVGFRHVRLCDMGKFASERRGSRAAIGEWLVTTSGATDCLV